MTDEIRVTEMTGTGTRINAHTGYTIDWSDPHYVARTWVVVLAYLMTDPRYLHL